MRQIHNRLLTIVLLSGLFFTAFPIRVISAVISSAEIEVCTINELGLNCENKLSIDTGVSYGIQTTLEGVKGTTIMVNGEPTIGPDEITNVEITKSQPQLIYPLRFLHRVPYYPHEEAIEVQLTNSTSTTDAMRCEDSANATGIPGQCIDSDSASAPTCGWTYQGSLKIPGSQGACNGNTAHCMRLGELYFDGYEIGSFHESYKVKHTLKKGSDTLAFDLSPMEPNYATNNIYWKLKARLSDNSATFRGAPQLDNYILYIPSSPETHPYVQDYQQNMLLIPREEVSTDGSQCNKVGTSFKTFRDWAASMDPERTDGCLNNQLFHKHQSDLQKLTMDPEAETRYLVQGKKDFKHSMTFNSGMRKELVYNIDEINYSTTTLIMDMDTLKVVSTESLGIIKEAFAKSFSSMSRNGTIVAKIQNYGDLKTDYVVTVSECNMQINEAVPAQARILEPLGDAELYFDIDTRYNLDTTNECLVQIKSNTGRLYDEVIVRFDSMKHPVDYAWQLSQSNEATEYVCKLEQVTIKGDFNNDGCVDRSDYIALLAVIRTSSNDPEYDLNGDNLVDFKDARNLVTLFTNKKGAPCKSHGKKGKKNKVHPNNWH